MSSPEKASWATHIGGIAARDPDACFSLLHLSDGSPTDDRTVAALAVAFTSALIFDTPVQVGCPSSYLLIRHRKRLY